MPPTAAATGSAARRRSSRVAQVAGDELALEFQAADEEEDSQQPVGSPGGSLADRLDGSNSNHQSALSLPEQPEPKLPALSMLGILPATADNSGGAASNPHDVHADLALLARAGMTVQSVSAELGLEGGDCGRGTTTVSDGQ